MILVVYVTGIGCMSVALALAARRNAKLEAQLAQTRLALHCQLARAAGEQYLRDLTLDWERHVELEGLELEDGEAAAHAFADFLAQATGQPIVATQVDGDGLIVAIPNPPENPDAR